MQERRLGMQEAGSKNGHETTTTKGGREREVGLQVEGHSFYDLQHKTKPELITLHFFFPKFDHGN